MAGIRQIFNVGSTLRQFLLILSVCLFVLSAYAAHQLGDLAPRGAPDGQLNAGDLVIMQRLSVGELTPTADELKIGDVAPLSGPDGVVNAADLLILTRALLGEITLGTVNVPPPSPVLNAVVSPTNSNPFLITGSASLGVNVEIYVNASLQMQVTSSATDGSFSANVYLFDGLNQIYAVENDGSDVSDPSNTVQVQYDNVINRAQGGTITTDTVWTPGIPADPYIISGSLTVQSGVSLILQPGTMLQLGNGVIFDVRGNLEIRGTTGSPVVLTSVNPGVTNWFGLVISGGTALIDYAQIEWADNGVYSSTWASSDITVTNSVINNVGKGIFFNNVASGVVVSNTVNNVTTGIDFRDVASGVISNNTLTSAGIWGIVLINTFIDVNLNTITCGLNASGNAQGTGIDLTDASPHLENNTIQTCSTGIRISGLSNPLIDNGNIITGTNTGITMSGSGTGGPQPIINDNSIYSNTTNNISASGYVNTVTRIDATGNWWGTLDVYDIAGSIQDNKTSSLLPVIDFTPFLDMPNGVPVIGNYIDGGSILTSLNILSGEQYYVTGDAVVPAGLSVAIADGATLDFVKYSGLTVQGALDINGTLNNPVILTSASLDVELFEPPSALRGDWEGVVVASTADNISIDYAIISWADTGVDIQGVLNPVVTNSTINWFSTAGVSYTNVASGIFRDNLVFNLIGFSGGPKVGTGVDLNQSSITIDSNVIRETFKGIDLLSSNPVITNNEILNNQAGLSMVSSSPTVQGNDFHDNFTALLIEKLSNPIINGNNLFHDDINEINVRGDNLTGNNPNPIINGNSFYGTASLYYRASNFFDSANVQLDATSNWWGTDDINVISQKISSSSGNSVPTINIFPYQLVENGRLSNIPFLLGTLTANTLLLSGTTHYISNLTVPLGITLTIEEGVNLLFTSNAGLAVDGTLIAQGSAQSPIVFTSASDSPVRGEWDGVALSSTASNSVFDHVVVSWAKTAVDVTGASNVTVSNSEINKFSIVGINYTSGATGQIIGNKVDSLQSSSMICIKLDASSPTVDNNIVGSCGIGISARNNAAPSITNNILSSNNSGIEVIGSSPLIDSNLIDLSKFSGIVISGGGANPIITNNQIINTTTGSGIKVFGTNDDTTNPRPIINNNDIFGNRDFGLFVSGYGVSSGIVLDVTGNYWGGGAPSVSIATNSPSNMVDSSQSLASQIYGPVISNVAVTTVYISPNADGLKDTTVISASLSESADWVVSIYNENGTTLIKTFQNTGSLISATWDGRNESSQLQLDGVYQVKISASIGNGPKTRTSLENNAVTLFIDTIAPTVNIVEPLNNSTYTSELSVPIIGTLSDSNATTYTLEIGAGLAPVTWTPFVTDQAIPLTMALLTEWVVNNVDGTALVQSGDHIIRVTVKDGADNSTVSLLNITIDNLTITNVTTNAITIRPSSGEVLNLNFTINEAATVTLNITNHLTSQLVRSIPVVFSSGGAKVILWDGKNNAGGYVADEAYVYTLIATSGVKAAEYKPIDPALVSFPTGSLNIRYDATTNLFWKSFIDFTGPTRMTLSVSCNNTASCVNAGSFYVHYQVPFENYTWLYWDGRDADGNEIDGNDYSYLIRPFVDLPDNIVIVKDAAPFITGEGGAAAAPNIEVKSNPYLITHSYDELSQVKFQIDQNSTVTVKLLPPGINDPNDPSAITLMNPTILNAEISPDVPDIHMFEWDGYDTTAPESEINNMLVDEEGMYTFTIEAISEVTGFRTLYRGALSLYR